MSPSWVYKASGTARSAIASTSKRAGATSATTIRATSNSDEEYFWRDSDAAGADRRARRDRRPIAIASRSTGAATYFLDTKYGSHTFKFGGEIYNETQWSGRSQNVGGNIEHIYNNGVASQVVFGVPTATCVCGRYASDDGQLLVVNKLDQQDFFINDTWSKGRVTMNLGLRWDRYNGWMPEQEQLAFSNGPVSVPAQTFPERDFFTWNNLGPRIGVTYDLAGDGKTVMKASYGLFWHNPGPGVSADANPNQNNKSVTYTWNDRNGDRHYQAGEEVGATRPRPRWPARSRSIRTSPRRTRTTRRSTSSARSRRRIGTRVGFVYKTEDDLIAQYNPGRPISAYTVPYTVVDPGVDGVTGTADDRRINLLGVPNTADVNTRFPLTNVTQNTPRFSRYKTVEASMNKRLSNHWSAQIGGSYTWAHDFPGAYPNTPNGAFDEDNTRWDFKVSGTYEAPYGIRLSPLVRHQAGANFARQISVGAGGRHRGRRDLQRHDQRRAAELEPPRQHHGARPPRRPRLQPGRTACACAALFDLFNITNSNAAETADDHDRHGVPAPDRGARAAHGAHRRAVVVLSRCIGR